MITLEQAKANLRVRHNDQDVLISDLVARSLSALQRLTGEGYDENSAELDAAQLLLVEWWYNPAEKVELDEIYHLPRAVVATAVHYRTPTVV